MPEMVVASLRGVGVLVVNYCPQGYQTTDPGSHEAAETPRYTGPSIFLYVEVSFCADRDHFCCRQLFGILGGHGAYRRLC